MVDQPPQPEDLNNAEPHRALPDRFPGPPGSKSFDLRADCRHAQHVDLERDSGAMRTRATFQGATPGTISAVTRARNVSIETMPEHHF